MEGKRRGLYGISSWRGYNEAWMTHVTQYHNSHQATWVHYEGLLFAPSLALRHILEALKLERVLMADLRVIAERQSFANRKTGEGLREDMKELNDKVLRQGTQGEWREVFTTKQADWAARMWGENLKKLGYS